MHVPCLWYQEELQRQVDDQQKTGEINGLEEVGLNFVPLKANPFLTIVMPNGDNWNFDLCLIHGEIKALGKALEASNGRDENSSAANPDQLL